MALLMHAQDFLLSPVWKRLLAVRVGFHDRASRADRSCHVHAKFFREGQRAGKKLVWGAARLAEKMQRGRSSQPGQPQGWKSFNKGSREAWERRTGRQTQTGLLSMGKRGRK